METEANKAVVRRLFAEVFNGGRLAVVDEIIAADVLAHDATASGRWRSSSSAPSRMRTTPLVDLIADGDKVAARWGLEGTHRGPFMSVAPTGRRVSNAGHHHLPAGARADRRVLGHL